MNILLLLAANIIPLYVLIALGYIAGRWLDVNLHSIARLAIFIIAPIVIFGAVAQLDFSPRYTLLPFIAAGMSLCISLPVYFAAQKHWKNNTANLIGSGSVAGNTGYFGLPLVLALTGPESAGIYLFMNFGIQIMELTLSYFMAARGHFSVRESLQKVLRMPALHALYVALIFNLSGFELPDIFLKYWTYAMGTWVFLGIMLIGIALGKIEKFEWAPRLLTWLFTVKFIFWPVIGIGFILADQHFLHLFSPSIHIMMLILVSVPLMGNLVAYAAQLNLHPEKAATAVLLSTLFAIIYMPAIFWLGRILGISH